MIMMRMRMLVLTKKTYANKMKRLMIKTVMKQSQHPNQYHRCERLPKLTQHVHGTCLMSSTVIITSHRKCSITAVRCTSLMPVSQGDESCLGMRSCAVMPVHYPVLLHWQLPVMPSMHIETRYRVNCLQTKITIIIVHPLRVFVVYLPHSVRINRFWPAPSAAAQAAAHPM